MPCCCAWHACGRVAACMQKGTPYVRRDGRAREAHADVGGQDNDGVIDELQAQLQRDHAGARSTVVRKRAVQLSGDGRHCDAEVGRRGGQPV